MTSYDAIGTGRAKLNLGLYEIYMSTVIIMLIYMSTVIIMLTYMSTVIIMLFQGSLLVQLSSLLFYTLYVDMNSIQYATRRFSN